MNNHEHHNQLALNHSHRVLKAGDTNDLGQIAASDVQREFNLFFMDGHSAWSEWLRLASLDGPWDAFNLLELEPRAFGRVAKQIVCKAEGWQPGPAVSPQLLLAANRWCQDLSNKFETETANGPSGGVAAFAGPVKQAA